MRQLKISHSITTRDSQSLNRYLLEIGKIEMLRPEEEVDLARLIKEGDKKALERLTRANLRFVVSVAKQYQGQGLSLADLINEGNIGLITSARRFDPSKGFKFISFAVWWIRQSIMQALAAHARTIRMPMNKLAITSRIRKTTSILEQQLQRMPSDEELAEAMQMNEEELAQTMSWNQQVVSLDTPIDEDGENSMLDVIENPNASKADDHLHHHESLKTEINRLLDRLPGRNRQILCEFFGIGIEHSLSIEELARKFELSVERIRQIKDKALEKLRACLNYETLCGFLAA